MPNFRALEGLNDIDDINTMNENRSLVGYTARDNLRTIVLNWFEADVIIM